MNLLGCWKTYDLIYFLCRSFEEVCTQLHSSIEIFLKLLQEKVFPGKDALIQRLYAALRIINSVRHPKNLSLSLFRSASEFHFFREILFNA